MVTTSSSSSAVLVAAGPVFSEPERRALAGFLAGYSSLTREAYTLDLRQFAAWCHGRGLALFAARRADVELFGRDLEAASRARAAVTRRLCTVAGFYPVRRGRRTPGSLTGRPRPPSASGLRVSRRRPGPQRARRPAGTPTRLAAARM